MYIFSTVLFFLSELHVVSFPFTFLFFSSDERDAVQKKTFTKWVNSHLSRVSCRISDLYNDLRDGYMLTRLLEVLSGELLVRTQLWNLGEQMWTILLSCLMLQSH